MINSVEELVADMKNAISLSGRQGLGIAAIARVKAAVHTQGYNSDSQVLAEIANVLTATALVDADKSIPWVMDERKATA